MTDLGPDDPYQILGVPRGASDKAILSAHRALARRFHPDLAGDHATAQMVIINAAFEAIRTASARAALDDRESHGARTRSPSTTPAPTTAGAEQSHRRWGTQRDGTGGAGPPPGRPRGSVLKFGRHIGWSIGEIAHADPGYLVWLSERREGRPYLGEILTALRDAGHLGLAESLARSSAHANGGDLLGGSFNRP